MSFGFNCPKHSPEAVKVSIGGINAITGLGKNDENAPVQDYLCTKQPWLDGVAYEPGVVRQFTAVTVEDGYTIEEQLTGKVSMRPCIKTATK